MIKITPKPKMDSDEIDAIHGLIEERQPRRVLERGWKIAYLTHVYCQHIGRVSVRNDKRLGHELDLVKPIDAETLLPPKEYRG